MTGDEADEGWVASEWVYVGRRWSSISRKLFHAFIPADFDGPEGEAIRWFDRATPGAFVGEVLVIEHNPESGKARLADANHERSLVGEDERVPSWSLEDRAAAAALETERARKRWAKEAKDFGDLTLREVRDAVARQPRHVGAGTANEVLDYVMGGRR